MYSRQTTCWAVEIHAERINTGIPHFYSNYLFCKLASAGDVHQRLWSNATQAFTHCQPVNGNVYFDYGMFEDGIRREILTTNFARKYFYSLWWGVQNLRSIKQFSSLIDLQLSFHFFELM